MAFLSTMFDRSPPAALDPPLRDSVTGMAATTDTPPTIVSISDIHGYLDDARSALLTLADHPDYAPVVVSDDDGVLHWADENYVLVFNGDLIDRGPSNAETVQMVARLIREAPAGRVRCTLGNHEAIALLPDRLPFPNWYSGQLEAGARHRLLEWITAGHVVAAYKGHNVTYVHAGASEPYDVGTVNDDLVEAAGLLVDALGTPDDADAQRRAVEEYSQVLGVGDRHPKGPTAGIVWLDFEYLSPESPPQVVGHTRHESPVQKGSVFCQNVIRKNHDRSGGEGVFVETPTSLHSLTRGRGDEVHVEQLASFGE